jgi:hypothetical protein
VDTSRIIDVFSAAVNTQTAFVTDLELLAFRTLVALVADPVIIVAAVRAMLAALSAFLIFFVAPTFVTFGTVVAQFLNTIVTALTLFAHIFLFAANTAAYTVTVLRA